MRSHSLLSPCVGIVGDLWCPVRDCSLRPPHCSHCRPVWGVGGYGRPVKDCLGLPVVSCCPVRVVGGCVLPREESGDGKRLCSCPPGGLSWLPVAKVSTSVVPPGSRASAPMNKFVRESLPGALAAGSFGLRVDCAPSSPGSGGVRRCARRSPGGRRREIVQRVFVSLLPAFSLGSPPTFTT